MRKSVAMWVFVIAGLVVAAWAVAAWVSPQVTCRGEAMGPGDTCSHLSLNGSDDGLVQTYEQRLATARQQAPFGVLAGVAMAGFGVAVLQGSRRRG